METTTTPVKGKKKLKIHIGLATIVCDVDDNIIEAMFDPTLKVKDCTDLVEELKKMNTPMEKQAELIVSSWFNRVSEVELADRQKYHMVTKNLGTVPTPAHYPEGSKAHKYYFTLEEI